eukprot:1117409-Pyramimonas_sp.AAC.1
MCSISSLRDGPSRAARSSARRAGTACRGSDQPRGALVTEQTANRARRERELTITEVLLPSKPQNIKKSPETRSLLQPGPALALLVAMH